MVPLWASRPPKAVLEGRAISFSFASHSTPHYTITMPVLFYIFGRRLYARRHWPSPPRPPFCCHLRSACSSVRQAHYHYHNALRIILNINIAVLLNEKLLLQFHSWKERAMTTLQIPLALAVTPGPLALTAAPRPRWGIYLASGDPKAARLHANGQRSPASAPLQPIHSQWMDMV